MNELDPDQQRIEDLLQNLTFAEPSPNLDESIEAMLSRGPRRWTGPLLGFAAGVLATAAVMLAVPRQAVGERPAAPAGPSPVISAPASTGEKSLAVLVQPQRRVEEFTAMVNGEPVQLERTDLQYVVWPAGGGEPAKIDVPDAATVRQVIQY